MNRAITLPSSPIVVTPESACHAGGRGFESRRSRLLKSLQIDISVVQSDAPLRLVAQSRGPNVERELPAKHPFPYWDS
jgi:hypothetical protein